MRLQSGWEEVSKAAVCALHFPPRPAQGGTQQTINGNTWNCRHCFHQLYLLHVSVNNLPYAGAKFLAAVLDATQSQL